MRYLLLACVLAAFMLAVTPALAKPKYNPFRVPRDSIVANVKTIALANVQGVPDEELRRPAILAEFDSLLAAELRSAGFQVVQAAVVDSVEKRIRDSLGGLFDPATGKPDTMKVRQLHQGVSDALRDEHRADAWLHGTFSVHAAEFAGGTARWMGTTEIVRPKGLLGFLGAGRITGAVPALALSVAMEDMTGRDLYVDFGGLQVLKKYTQSERFVEVPKDSLWASPKRNSDAVRLAMEALTRPPKR